MKKPKRPAFCLLLVTTLLSGCIRSGQKDTGYQKIGPQKDGSFLVPSNQLLCPAGFQVYLPGRPVDLALTKDGRFLLVKNMTDRIRFLPAEFTDVVAGLMFQI